MEREAIPLRDELGNLISLPSGGSPSWTALGVTHRLPQTLRSSIDLFGWGKHEKNKAGAFG
jgi:hypothetical protein